MILTIDQHYMGYNEIINNCRPDGQNSNSGSVLLLCHPDVDALAAARIWSFMLRSEGIAYQLVPCPSHRSLAELMTTILPKDDDNNNDNDIRACILLNFGASLNLTKWYNRMEWLGPETKLFVVDGKRPVHLANIHAGPNIVIFWDNQRGVPDLPSDGEDLSANEEEEDSEDDEEDDSDDDDDDDDDDSTDAAEPSDDEEEAEFDGRQQQQRDNDAGEDYDGEDEAEQDDGLPAGDRVRPRERDDMGASASKRLRSESADASADDDDDDDDQRDQQHGPSSSTQLTLAEQHQERRNRVRKYYSSGSFFGTPASYTAFRLASQARFGSLGDLLWLACVGVTDAYLHARLDMAVYAQLAGDLKNDCRRLFPNDMYSRSAEAVFAEDLINSNNDSNDNRHSTKITFSDNGRILSQNDYKFFLLRHSSLYDSMVSSDYVSARLQIWTQQGRHQLHELLAKMGFPLDECRQPFAFMKPALRRRLHEKIGEFAEEYGLEKFEMTSFFRVVGYQSLLAASDTAYAVSALLEADMTDTTDEKEATMQAFHVAYDALFPSSSRESTSSPTSVTASSLVNGSHLMGRVGIQGGLRMAMALQRQILSTAVGLIERKALTRLRHFRYAYLTCTSAGENQSSSISSRLAHLAAASSPEKNASESQPDHIFAKPIALCRLAQYLMNVHRENGKWIGETSRPLVLMAEKPRTDTYLVAGYEYTERAGSFVKNKFGHYFQLTAESMNATTKFDSFDANVVEVASSDVQRFIEQLHYIMDSI